MDVVAEAQPLGRIWYFDLSGDQRKAFWAAYLGWTLDGFDYYILSLLLVDVQRSFTVSSALAGALATVTLMFRVLGGIGAGIVADRFGRKLPLMLAILWYSSFAFLSAFSTSYGMLFACRALFGVGMGGVWSAGMPLAIEHCPPQHRGLVQHHLLQPGEGEQRQQEGDVALPRRWQPRQGQAEADRRTQRRGDAAARLPVVAPPFRRQRAALP